MSLLWADVTRGLVEGIKQINSINNKKFPLLLERISEAVEENKEPFTAEETQKLCVTFNKTKDEMSLTLQTIKYILSQSGKYLMKPTTLQQDLTEKLGFSEEISICFAQLWTKNVKNTIDNLQDLQQLEKVSWELNLEISNDTQTKIAAPTSILQMDTKSESAQHKILVEMNEEELLNFYNVIENIQSTLDSIQR